MCEFSKAIASNQSKELFFIHYGLTAKQLEQLIKFTNIEKDPINLDGDEERFKTLELYQIWRRKSRTIYSLSDRVGEDGNLGGIFWAGEKKLPDRDDYLEILDPEFYRYTYAFRLYDSARGKGLSYPVLSVCMDKYLNGLTLPLGFWLEVSGLNPPALRMDQKMGFKIVSGLNNQNRLILARKYGL